MLCNEEVIPWYRAIERRGGDTPTTRKQNEALDDATVQGFLLPLTPGE